MKRLRISASVFLMTFLFFSPVSHTFFDPLSFTASHSPSIRTSSSTPAGRYRRVVVMTSRQSAASGPVRYSPGDESADFITLELLDRGYRVLDSQDLSAVMREHKLQYSGYVDETTAVRIGRWAGADALFIANLYGKNTTYHRGPKIQIPGVPNFPDLFPSGNVRQINMSLKMIDVQTRDIVWFADGSNQSSPGEPVLDTDLIRELIRAVPFPRRF